ncbi:hypothetical protein MKW98_016375 [Papaver atlanticum]|uniref:PGG domain-containing protein n=1 Tax=Papaver atlanticum TaxID=357466 RepID=A0AAD4RVW4_9MAGN|nr:hypothetical protein MKW98_016375 [Papaver atlanticum]
MSTTTAAIREGDEQDHKSAKETSMLLHEVFESQQRRIESLERNQQPLIETLTTINKALTQVLTHQNNPTEGEKKPIIDEEKEQKTAENTADIPYITEEYEDLVSAVSERDWESAKSFLEAHPLAKTNAFTSFSETAVHLATYCDNWEFVVKLVEFLPKEILKLQEKQYGYTVLHMAAYRGKYEAAVAMVRKNRNLIEIRDNEGNLPLETAMLSTPTEQNKSTPTEQQKTVEYLYSATKHYYPVLFSGTVGAKLLCTTIEASCYDVASRILKELPSLVMEKIEKREMYIFELMAYRPFAFKSGTKLSRWEDNVYELIHVQTNNIEENPLENNIEDEENPLESSQGPIRDTENPLGSSEVTKENEKTASVGVVTKLISGNNMPFYARVPLLGHLYKMKLMHEQADNLVTQILNILDDKTKTKSEVIDIFSKTDMVHTAIKYGISEFVEKCLDTFPFLVSHELGKKTMMQMAVTERNEAIFDYLIECICYDDKKDDIICKEDENCNNILHYTAILAPPQQLNSVSGPALQMQRELQWFKGVASLVYPFLMHTRNVDLKTAQYVFTEQHKSLREAGEKWLKDTSGSCMLVATLIATVAFAAAFTVPGGNVSDSSNPKSASGDPKSNSAVPKIGFPVFLRENTFAVYAAADAVALFSSITSVVMFLAIMTSRYAEKDFLKSLPQKLIIGLTTLFISMASILVAFGAAFTLVLRDRYPWAPFPIACFGVISVLLFFLLEVPLLLEMMRVTYWPSVLNKKNRQPLFSEKEKQKTLKRDRIKQMAKKEKEI